MIELIFQQCGSRTSPLFIGSTTDDWGAGTGATGNWEANYAEGSQ